MTTFTINAEKHDRITGFASNGRTARIEMRADGKWSTFGYEPTRLVKYTDDTRELAIANMGAFFLAE